MGFLTGWKEIAEHLHLGVRTAQRWERLGLPVRRASNSRCSPVVAVPDELEKWIRRRKMKGIGYERSFESNMSQFRATRRKTRKLTRELRNLRIEHRMLLSLVREQVTQGGGRDSQRKEEILNRQSIAADFTDPSQGSRAESMHVFLGRH